jgi:lipopolysaccharide/colanic/teichoic acid biosynthesis glycosyltransferase
MHLASLILSSTTGGRVITIRPEQDVEHDARITDAIGTEVIELDEQADTAQLSDTWTQRSTFSMGSYARFNRTSEALDIWEASPDIGELPTQTRKYELGKRIFDIMLAILIFPIVAIMIVLIGGLIALTAGWPVFYRQRRIGQHGREFFIWKFRTMHLHGERILAEHLKRDAGARDEWHHTYKLRNDPRITQLGKLLRKTSLDELPQIFNVFSGDMSFVGPRPIIRAETMKYAERFPYYLAAVPGITGLWQVSGRSDVSYETRVILDETYVCKWSMIRDLWILLKTPRAVCNRDGAY